MTQSVRAFALHAGGLGVRIAATTDINHKTVSDSCTANRVCHRSSEIAIEMNARVTVSVAR